MAGNIINTLLLVNNFSRHEPYHLLEMSLLWSCLTIGTYLSKYAVISFKYFFVLIYTF